MTCNKSMKCIDCHNQGIMCLHEMIGIIDDDINIQKVKGGLIKENEKTKD